MIDAISPTFANKIQARQEELKEVRRLQQRAGNGESTTVTISKEAMNLQKNNKQIEDNIENIKENKKQVDKRIEEYKNFMREKEAEVIANSEK